MPPLLHRRQPSHGFTFVELVLVVMVLGIMAGVAAPRYQAALASIEVATAAKELAAHLRYVRQEAINRSVALGIEFDLNAGTYQSTSLDGQTVSDPDHPDQLLRVRLTPSSGRVGLVHASWTTGQVVFDIHGDTSAADEVLLSSGVSVAKVRWNTLGEVTVER